MCRGRFQPRPYSKQSAGRKIISARRFFYVDFTLLSYTLRVGLEQHRNGFRRKRGDNMANRFTLRIPALAAALLGGVLAGSVALAQPPPSGGPGYGGPGGAGRGRRPVGGPRGGPRPAVPARAAEGGRGGPSRPGGTVRKMFG